LAHLARTAALFRARPGLPRLRDQGGLPRRTESAGSAIDAGAAKKIADADLDLTVKKAVKATDEHRQTQIRKSCEKKQSHPTDGRRFSERSVFICGHLWLPLFP
jgi:hypothetical protein